MITQQDYVINGKHDKPILVDTTYLSEKRNLPVIIFCHGYKGYKDWGAWHLMAKAFAKSGFFFVKFNFSHNGGTIEQPIDFPDLEAFGMNNYTKELDDLETVIDWVFNNDLLRSHLNLNRISLMGHSRGGGIAGIKAQEDSRIQQLISLASVSDFGKRLSTTGDLEQWKKEGVTYVLNGRTKQKMPHYYQFYEDFKKHETRLDIKRAISHLNKPHLILHGAQDSSVDIGASKRLHEWNPSSVFRVIKHADHVFNTKQPWDLKKLSPELEEVVLACITFLKD